MAFEKFRTEYRKRKDYKAAQKGKEVRFKKKKGKRRIDFKEFKATQKETIVDSFFDRIIRGL